MTPNDLASCRRLLREGSRSFFFASRLLPRGIRDDATALYAFCRVADDAIDTGGDPGAALRDLARRLDAACAGKPCDHAVDRAMAGVIARHAMPRALPYALLEGLAWDVSGRRYDELSDVRAYGARVAGSVGVMMAWLMGLRDSDTLARACELGIAMQLTNIARDVGEDARNARVYLPARWLAEAGVPADSLSAQPSHHPALALVVERLLDRADEHYRYGEVGIARLPWRCRPGIRAAARIYRAIGQQLRAYGCDAINQRAVVPAATKLGLLTNAVLKPGPRTKHRPVNQPTLKPPSSAEIAFMIDPAVRAAQKIAVNSSRDARIIRVQELHWWQFGMRWAWVCQLFAVIEARRALDKQKNEASNRVSQSTVTHER